jgi:outer membrane protein
MTFIGRIVGFGFLLNIAWAQPLDFAKALELSLQSPSVVLAQGQVDLVQKQLEVAQGVISGQLTAGYTQSWGESASTVAGVEQTTSLDEGSFNAFNLSATFKVVPFGPSADSIQKAIWSVEQAQRNLRDAISEAIINTVQAFVNVLRSQESLELQMFATDLASQELEAAKVRQASGAITQQQLLQAEIALSQAQNNFSEAQRVLLQALAGLSNQLGVQVDSVMGDIPRGVLVELDREEGLQQRSDIINAKVAVLEAELNAESTKRQYLPSGSLDLGYASNDNERQFSLTAGYDTQSYQPNLRLSYDPSFSQGQGGSSSSFSLTLSATIPIETSIFPALEAARLSIEQSQMQAERVEELAGLEIENVSRQLEAANANIALSQQILDQSQQTFDTAKERLELGVITQLDLLGAEKALLEAKLNFAKAKDQYLLSLLQYAQSLAVDLMEVF